jgi:hypothetical protein
LICESGQNQRVFGSDQSPLGWAAFPDQRH